MISTNFEFTVSSTASTIQSLGVTAKSYQYDWSAPFVYEMMSGIAESTYLEVIVDLPATSNLDISMKVNTDIQNPLSVQISCSNIVSTNPKYSVSVIAQHDRMIPPTYVFLG